LRVSASSVMTGRAWRIARSPEGLIRLPHRLADLCTVFNQNSYERHDKFAVHSVFISAALPKTA
jgi:hypothetical protein